MAQHVDVGFDPELRFDACSLDHTRESLPRLVVRRVHSRR
jgi:hypothetical protein